MLELKELKELHDKAYNNGIITRERASEDLAFYWVSSWQDNALDDSNLQFRGEFNILRKAGRQISGDLRSNPVQVNFDPKATSRDDGAELLDGLYRSDERTNTSIEAYDNASGEAIVCGVGAWELITEYETNNAGDDNQIIRRKPIYEANNNVFWDANAKLLDKSDANHVSILTAYSKDGYEALVKELTGEVSPDMSSFSHPEESYSFPWIGSRNTVWYVATFYHRAKIKDKIITLEDPLGQPIKLYKKQVEKVMDELIDEGYSIVEEKSIDRWEVTKYIASGADILSSDVIAGENIPVIPVYGERAFVEAEEHYEGVTRLAKDPQRLRNFMLSYLADIASRSPRKKPIFTAEMVKGFENMYEENGADNNFPYYLMNSKDKEGMPLTPPPILEMPTADVPLAVTQMMQETRIAVADVANAGVPTDIADVDLSGKAVAMLQNRLDQQSIIYQENLKHAKRRDGEVYASMASTVYDAPRTVTLTSADGSRKKEDIMTSVVDQQTGEMVILNDLTNIEFDVYADISTSYKSQKEETVETLDKLMERAVAMGDPALIQLLMNKQLMMIDGVDTKDLRDYGRKNLLMAGIIEPETDEEKQMLQQMMEQKAKEGEAPDPNMIVAQAEQSKADALMTEAQRKAKDDQNNHQIKQGELMVRQFDSQTKRQEVQVKAKEAGMNADFKRGDAMRARVDQALKGDDMRMNHQEKRDSMRGQMALS